MSRVLLSLLMLVPGAFGQIPIARLPFGVQISDALKNYLALSDAQVKAIEKVNSDFSEWQVSRTQRSATLQYEIALETAKSPLDPAALGIRYAELESIRREVNDEQGRVRTRIAAVLTEVQKSKVKALDDANRLQPVISDAMCNNLLLPPAPVASFAAGLITASPFPGGITSGCSSIASFILGPLTP